MDKKEKQAMYKVLLFASPSIIGGIMTIFLPKLTEQKGILI